jgi:hypothetical protein
LTARIAWRVIVPLIAVAIATGVVEVILRVRDDGGPSLTSDDPIRGWRLTPGFAGWMEDENHVWVSINSDGLRDREHPRTAPPRTVRVAVLGDSYMFAPNVPFERSFVPLLEARLTRCLSPAGRVAEAINFGVGAYGTAQEWLTYRAAAAKYRPEIVLLAIYTRNDLSDNSWELDGQPDSSRPYFTVRDGLLQRMPNPSTAALAALPRHQRIRLAITGRSHAAKLVWDGWSTLRAAMLGPQPVVEPPPALPDVAVARLVMAPPATEMMREAWQITEAIIAALAEEVRSDGRELWIMTLSNPEQVDPDLDARESLRRELGVETLYYADNRLATFAASQRIPIITLAQPFAHYSAQHHVYLNGGYNERYPPGTGHWNDTANQLAADLVGKAMCDGSRSILSPP